MSDSIIEYIVVFFVILLTFLGRRKKSVARRPPPVRVKAPEVASKPQALPRTVDHLSPSSQEEEPIAFRQSTYRRALRQSLKKREAIAMSVILSRHPET